MTRRIGSNLSYEQVHPVTHPGSACALSFIYESHYQCSAEQNNSDVIAFISFSVLTERYDPFGQQQLGKLELKWEIKTLKSFKTCLVKTMTKKNQALFCGSAHNEPEPR